MYIHIRIGRVAFVNVILRHMATEFQLLTGGSATMLAEYRQNGKQASYVVGTINTNCNIISSLVLRLLNEASCYPYRTLTFAERMPVQQTDYCRRYLSGMTECTNRES